MRSRRLSATVASIASILIALVLSSSLSSFSSSLAAASKDAAACSKLGCVSLSGLSFNGFRTEEKFLSSFFRLNVFSTRGEKKTLLSSSTSTAPRRERERGRGVRKKNFAPPCWLCKEKFYSLPERAPHRTRGAEGARRDKRTSTGSSLLLP